MYQDERSSPEPRRGEAPKGSPETTVQPRRPDLELMWMLPVLRVFTVDTHAGHCQGAIRREFVHLQSTDDSL
jgi:hypothetical protein